MEILRSLFESSDKPPLLWWTNELISKVDDTITKLGSKEFECREDRVEAIYQLLIDEGKNIRIFSTKTPPKCMNKSTEFRNEGNNYFKLNKLDNAIEAYTKSVAWAPPNSKELGMAYANRSAVLFKAKFMADCLEDIDRALVNNYPDNLKVKLYLRKATCLRALSPDDHSSIEAVFAEARQWLKKMDEKLQEPMDKLLKEQEASKRTEPITCYKLEDIDEGPRPQLHAENAIVPGLSDALELAYSEKYGRHIIATRDIKPGEILGVQKPYARIVDRKFKYRLCWHCGRQTLSALPCNNCPEVIFCSNQCRDDAHLEYHDGECSIIPELRDYGIPDLHLMALKITIMAYKESGKSLETLKSNVKKINAVKDRAKKGFTDGVLLPDKFASTQGMMSQPIRGLNHRGIRRECQSIVIGILSAFFFAKTIDLIDKSSKSINTTLNNDDLKFLVGFIEKNNCLTYTTLVEDKKLSQNGTNIDSSVLLPAFSFFNHQCIPMTARTNHSGYVISRSMCPIKKGQQVYEMLSEPFYRAPKNQRELEMKDHHFVCECDACVNNWPVLDVNNPVGVDNMQSARIMTPKLCKFIEKVDQVRKIYCNYALNEKKLMDVSKYVIEGAKLLEKSDKLLKKNSCLTVGLTYSFIDLNRYGEMPFFSLD